ncbi:MAG TPA: hypothetical protein ENI61_04105 [Ignavibacteria bacterium]|nr:hypothetical protein [Ignavibacteria bacterium]
MILEDVEGKFVNWANEKFFEGKFTGIEHISVKGENKEMCVFEKDNNTYYIGNYQILRILKHNLQKDIIGEDLKITVIGSVKTKAGNDMLKFSIETLVEPVERTRKNMVGESNQSTPGVPF